MTGFKTLASDNTAVLELAERISAVAWPLSTNLEPEEHAFAMIVAGLAKIEEAAPDLQIARLLAGLAELYVARSHVGERDPALNHSSRQALHMAHVGTALLEDGGLTSEEAVNAMLWAAGRVSVVTQGRQETAKVAYLMADGFATQSH
ncbi:hypothetical protein OB03_14365 [Brevundimonas sp. GN22]